MHQHQLVELKYAEKIMLAGAAKAEDPFARQLYLDAQEAIAGVLRWEAEWGEGKR